MREGFGWKGAFGFIMNERHNDCIHIMCSSHLSALVYIYSVLIILVNCADSSHYLLFTYVFVPVVQRDDFLILQARSFENFSVLCSLRAARPALLIRGVRELEAPCPSLSQLS